MIPAIPVHKAAQAVSLKMHFLKQGHFLESCPSVWTDQSVSIWAMPTASTLQHEFWQYKPRIQYSGVGPQVVQCKLDCALVDPSQLILSGHLECKSQKLQCSTEKVRRLWLLLFISWKASVSCIKVSEVFGAGNTFSPAHMKMGKNPHL